MFIATIFSPPEKIYHHVVVEYTSTWNYTGQTHMLYLLAPQYLHWSYLEQYTFQMTEYKNQSGVRNFAKQIDIPFSNYRVLTGLTNMLYCCSTPVRSRPRSEMSRFNLSKSYLLLMFRSAKYLREIPKFDNIIDLFF
jgi:hypothetical protein